MSHLIKVLCCLQIQLFLSLVVKELKQYTDEMITSRCFTIWICSVRALQFCLVGVKV